MISPLGLQFKKTQPKKCHHLIDFTTSICSTEFPRGPSWDQASPSSLHALGIVSKLRNRPSLQVPECKQTADMKGKKHRRLKCVVKIQWVRHKSESDSRPDDIFTLLFVSGEFLYLAPKAKMHMCSKVSAPGCIKLPRQGHIFILSHVDSGWYLPGVLGSLHTGCRGDQCTEGAHPGFPDNRVWATPSECLGILSKGLNKKRETKKPQPTSKFIFTQTKYSCPGYNNLRKQFILIWIKGTGIHDPALLPRNRATYDYN